MAFSMEKEKQPILLRGRSFRHLYARSYVLLLLLALFGASPALAHDPSPDPLSQLAFEQKLNEQVPPDIVLQDETGQPVQLRDYFGERPLILVFAYYECQNLCGVVLENLVESLRALEFDAGNQFRVITVSIDPGETPTLAAAKKATYIQRYGRPGAAAGWHFLTGDHASVDRLAQVVGFQYAYDAETDQYAHPAGLIILTPQGKISRYVYGLDYSPTDLRLGLVEASANKIGSLVDQVLLRCYRYDPVTGKYTLVVMNVLRLAGLATVLILGTFMVVMFRRDRGKDLKVVS